MTPEPAPLVLDPATAEALTGGRWHGPGGEVVVHGAVKDSRQVRRGCIFACFEGAHVDGHDYVDTAVGDGAALILATRTLKVPAPVLVVDDTAAALGTLAAEFRRRYQGGTWIGITGSNGKTTVKELLAAACACDGRVWATEGNYNNRIGVPLTVLATPAACRYVVVEMGASEPGEIADLAAMVRPDIGCITSIGPAHLEGFGGLDGVARAKCELASGVIEGGTVLFCRWGLEEVCAAYDTDLDRIMSTVRTAAVGRELTVIGDPGCPIDGEVTESGILLRTMVGEVGLRLVGGHNLANAAIAWHTAVAAGVDARHALGGLASAQPASGRLQVRKLGAHRLFDDSYNANPASMNAGLGVVARCAGARLAVLGAMGELGEDSDELHRGVGVEAARLGLPLLTVGTEAKAIGIGYRAAGGRDWVHVDDRAKAVAEILARFEVGPHAVLIKASRKAGLERVVTGVSDALGYGGAAGSGRMRVC